jgi:hypothetical protein
MPKNNRITSLYSIFTKLAQPILHYICLFLKFYLSCWKFWSLNIVPSAGVIRYHKVGMFNERSKLQADVVNVNLCLVFQLTRHLYGSV